MMATSNLQDKRIWLSGGTSGIGLALLKQLLENQAKVIVSGRNVESLSALQQQYPAHLHCIKVDLGKVEDLDFLQRELQQHYSYLDMLILNAGVCEYVDAHQLDMACVRRVMEVNFFAATQCCAIALPLLKKAPQKALIVGVSSLSTFAPFTRAEVYGASKAAFHYFLDCLRIDLAGHVDVSVVSPGFVDTPMTEQNNFPMPFMVSADTAAQKIMQAIKRRPMHLAFPFSFVVLLRLSALMPRLWLGFSVKMLNKTAR